MSSVIEMESNDNRESPTEFMDSTAPPTPTASYEGTITSPSEATTTADETDDCANVRVGGKSKQHKYRNENAENNATSSYVGNKNVAEGLMDIALLSANANQLRFLLTYNHSASTYYISTALVVISLIMQVVVGIALIFKVSLLLEIIVRIYDFNSIAAPLSSLSQQTLQRIHIGWCVSHNRGEYTAGCFYHHRCKQRT